MKTRLRLSLSRLLTVKSIINRNPTSRRFNRTTIISAFTFLLVSLLTSQAVCAQASRSSPPGAGTDFVEYWAASRLLLTGGNPYSPAQLGAVQATVAARATAPLIMWNPPWTLSFILPFGAPSFTVSQFLWLLLNLFLILWSAQNLWGIYANISTHPYTPWLLVLTFLPASFALMLGQITPLMLFGLTSFLYWERKQNGLATGASAVLISIKPQLCYLFWLSFVFWVWRQRRWRVFLGGSIAGLAVASIPAILNPGIYSSYITLYTVSGVTTPRDWAAPTLGNALRVWIVPDWSTLQFLPLAVGVAWLMYYWQRHKHSWNWSEQLPILLLVSVSTSAYAWTFDQVVLLPAIMQSASRLMRGPVTRYLWGIIMLYVAINVVYLTGKIFVLNDFWYFWMAPLFLLTYLLLQKRMVAGTAS
jgi:hypothetical protein